MIKKFLALVIALGCLTLNLSHSSAERWVRYSVPAPLGIIFVDFDSIAVKEYNPPKYVLTVTMATNVGNNLAYNYSTYQYNFDTKSISKYKFAIPYSYYQEATWDKQIAVDIWKHQYNMDFYAESKKGKLEKILKEAKEYYNREAYDVAIKLYTQALEIDPNNDLTYNDRGVAYRRLDQLEQAIVDYNKAIQLNPNASAYYCNRASAYYNSKQYEPALADLNKTIQLDPNDYDAYYYRGLTYYNLKQYEPALADFNKLIKFLPDDVDLLYNRALTYEQLKEYKKALKDYKKILKLDPNNKNAQKGIERVSKMK